MGSRGSEVKVVKYDPEALSLVVLSCILTFVPIFVPLLGLLLTLLAPFPLIILGLRYPWRYVLGLLGFETVVLLLLEGLPAVFLLNYYGVVPIVMVLAIRRNVSVSWLITASAVAPVILGAMFLGVASLMTHQSPRALLLQAFEWGVQAMQEYTQTLEQAQPASDTPIASDTAVPGLFLTLLPAMLVMNHVCTNVFNYVLVRCYCRQSRVSLHVEPEDLACWQPSDYLVWVFLASGVLVLLPLGLLSILGLNVFAVILMIYCWQGIAIAVFWGRQLPLPPGMRWLLGILVVMLAGPFCLLICTAMGLFDLWVDFRRQRHQPLVS